MKKTLQQIRSDGKLVMQRLSGVKAVNYRGKTWTSPYNHMDAVADMLIDHPNWKDDFDREASENNFGGLVDGKFKPGFSDYAQNPKTWITERDPWIDFKTKHAIKENMVGTRGTAEGYRGIKDKNGKLYYNVGAVKFRGKIYHGKENSVAIHADALTDLLKHYPADLVDRELQPENFGYYWVDGPLKGTFENDWQESDLARAMKENPTHKRKRINQQAKVNEDFAYYNEDGSYSAKPQGDMFVSAFLYKGVAHHGPKNGLMNHNELYFKMREGQVKTNKPLETLKKYRQFDKLMDSGKIEPGYYHADSNRWKSVGASKFKTIKQHIEY